jgi:hypothetical protein
MISNYPAFNCIFILRIFSWSNSINIQFLSKTWNKVFALNTPLNYKCIKQFTQVKVPSVKLVFTKIWTRWSLFSRLFVYFWHKIFEYLSQFCHSRQMRCRVQHWHFGFCRNSIWWCCLHPLPSWSFTVYVHTVIFHPLQYLNPLFTQARLLLSI